MRLPAMALAANCTGYGNGAVAPAGTYHALSDQPNLSTELTGRGHTQGRECGRDLYSTEVARSHGKTSLIGCKARRRTVLVGRFQAGPWRPLATFNLIKVEALSAGQALSLFVGLAAEN